MTSFGYEPPEFLIAAGHLHTFLTRLTRHHVKADFGATLTLRWDYRGQMARIAQISPRGLVWTDAGVAMLPGAEALAHRYVERLAAAWDMTVNRESFGGVWTVCGADDRLPALEDRLDKLDLWAETIEDLIDGLNAAPR